MTALVQRRRSWLWLQGLICGGAISFATAPVVLVAVMLAPGLVSYVAEKQSRKPVSETMLILGVATIFMPLRIFWENGHGFNSAMTILTNPYYLALSWAASCSGWLLEMLSQMIAVQFSDISVKRTMTALKRERAQLVEEWGPLIAMPPPLPAARRR